MITFEYQFKFDDGSSREFLVKIDPGTLLNADFDKECSSDWVDLEFNKCPHCPLKSSEHKSCPAAASLATVAEEFKAEVSHRPATVFVKTENRFYGKRTDVQGGLQSLFGLMLATSACPHMDIFKPMAIYHLPFSTFDETAIRALGTHFITEYFKAKDGEDPDFTLESFISYYDKISVVNHHLMSRIRSISKGDADRNAIIILDNFASLLPMEIKSGMEQIARTFRRNRQPVQNAGD